MGAYQEIIKKLDSKKIYYKVHFHDEIPTVEEAKKYNLVPTLLTFDPDPSFVLGFKKKNELIMPLSDRFKLVKELGIEDIVVLTFDKESMNLEPNEFIDYLLKNDLKKDNLYWSLCTNKEYVKIIYPIKECLPIISNNN